VSEQLISAKISRPCAPKYSYVQTVYVSCNSD